MTRLLKLIVLVAAIALPNVAFPSQPEPPVSGHFGFLTHSLPITDQPFSMPLHIEVDFDWTEIEIELLPGKMFARTDADRRGVNLSDPDIRIVAPDGGDSPSIVEQRVQFGLTGEDGLFLIKAFITVHRHPDLLKGRSPPPSFFTFSTSATVLVQSGRVWQGADLSNTADENKARSEFPHSSEAQAAIARGVSPDELGALEEAWVRQHVREWRKAQRGRAVRSAGR